MGNNVKEKIINYLKIYGGDIGEIWIKKNVQNGPKTTPTQHKYSWFGVCVSM